MASEHDRDRCRTRLMETKENGWCAFQGPKCAECPDASLPHQSVGAREDPLASDEIQRWLHGLNEAT